MISAFCFMHYASALRLLPQNRNLHYKLVYYKIFNLKKSQTTNYTS